MLEFYYTIYSSSSDYNEFDKRIQDEAAQLDYVRLCEKENNIVSLSGSGPMKFFQIMDLWEQKFLIIVTLVDIFRKLESIFPWASFYWVVLWNSFGERGIYHKCMVLRPATLTLISKWFKNLMAFHT